ncbi:MAG: hypothetical protein AAB802_05090 [Patescibacteria group bacterium]
MNLKTYMQDSGAKTQKIERLQTLVPQSQALRKTGMTSMDWAGVLAKLDDEKIDELLLILQEENEMLHMTEEERLRKRALNQSSYMQRLEKLRLSTELPSHSPKA